MCGIAGVIDRDEGRASDLVRRMNLMQFHRGPDNSVVARAGAATLGNTRLAILDRTEAGNQPFSSADGRYMCVFNGEIYNYLELIERFKLRPATGCDGAIIPELWQREGPDCLRLFRGMFAIAVADTHENALTLCRDPFGIKPLFYRTLPGDVLAFASEVRTLASLSPDPRLSPRAIASFFHLGAMPGDQSPFEEIVGVEPGGAVTFRVGPTPVQSSVYAENPAAVGESRDLRTVFTESVRLHLRSDVPTVLLLSAGVDSTSIALAAARLGVKLHCMTVAGVGGSDEAGVAARTAARYGHNHQVVPPQVDDADLKAFVEATQRPTIDGLNTFLVCTAVRRHGFRVALSGLGGDEALGGYPHFRLLPVVRARHLAERVPGLLGATASVVRRLPISPKAGRLLAPDGPTSACGLDLLQRELFPTDVVRALTGTDPELAEPADGDACTFRALVDAEIRNYLQRTLLPDADAYSMCSSVELRVPFVDQFVFASSTRTAESRRTFDGKASFVEAMADSHLESIARHRKRGFSVPIASWLEHGALRKLLSDAQNPDAPVWRVVDPAVGMPLVNRPPHHRWAEPWSFAILNAWLASQPVAG
jgi:asparagine synthase (glutamine-hydrolysing)